MGVVTRVRFEAEGRDHADVLEALDEATMLLRPQAPASSSYQHTADGEVMVSGSVSNLAQGGLADEVGFVMDTEFVEETIDSKVRHDGAIYYVGRRVLKMVPRVTDLPVIFQAGGVDPGDTPDYDPGNNTLYAPPRERRLGDGIPVDVEVCGARTNVWMSPHATVAAAATAAASAQGFGEIDLMRWRVVGGGEALTWEQIQEAPAAAFGRSLKLDPLGNQGYAVRF